MENKRLLKLKLFLLASIGWITVQATIIKVPAEYLNIQDAIDVAVIHDTVLVDTGTYFENIIFRGKNLVLASKYILEQNTEYILKTIINGSNGIQGDTSSCVSFLNGEDSTAVLQGFTLTKGSATLVVNNGNNLIEGGGIIIFNASPTIKNNIITDNQAKAGGGGIASFNNSHPNIYNNIIANNISSYAGGIVLNWCGGEIKNNIVFGNKTVGIYGTGGIMVWENSKDTAYIENNTVIGNSSSTTAGGLSTNRAGYTYIRNNLVKSNFQNTGNEISIINTTTFEYNNSFLNVGQQGNINVDPEFVSSLFSLLNQSAGIDLGNPGSGFNDIESGSPGIASVPSKGTIRNDIGAFGGPHAMEFPQFPLQQIITNKNLLYLMEIDDTLSRNIIIKNISSSALTIDSIIFPSSVNGILPNSKFESYKIPPLKTDTITITITASDKISLNDSFLIYHNMDWIMNPLAITFMYDSKKEGGDSIENLIAHWKFNELSGVNVLDEIGTSNGIFTGSITKVDGVDGKCIGFNKNGIKGVVSIPATDSINFGVDESFTISMWFKCNPVNYQDEVFLFIKGTVDGKWYAISLKSRQLRFTIDDNLTKTTINYVLPDNFNSKKWHHVIAVRDCNTHELFLYLDSELCGTVADNTNESIESNLPLLLNNYNPTVNTGIDDVRIYGNALKWYEVADLYHSCYLPGLSSGCLLETLEVTGYNFNEGPFAPSSFNYSVVLEKGSTKAIIDAAPENYFARVTGTGNFSSIPGHASVIVTSEDGASSNTYNIDFTVNNTSDIDLTNNKTSLLTIYPVPATEKVNISVNEMSIGKILNIYNSIGVIIKTVDITERILQLDISNFSKGIYIFQIENSSEKLIIQ